MLLSYVDIQNGLELELVSADSAEATAFFYSTRNFELTTCVFLMHRFEQNNVVLSY